MDVRVADSGDIEADQEFIGACRIERNIRDWQLETPALTRERLTWLRDGHNFDFDLKIGAFIDNDACFALLRYHKGRFSLCDRHCFMGW
jgi:hypothetical protein